MKLFLLIALVAVAVVVVMSLKRGGTRITRIESRHEKDRDDA